jgi:trimeric autotransporter adhesin
MKRFLLILAVPLLLSATAHSQVTGTFSIPGTPYATIASAIAAINSSGVGAGGATFNVVAGYTETFSSLSDGLISTTTSSVSDPINFQRSGEGSNPVITAATGIGTADFIICISGTSYVTFDGIDLQENAVNIDLTSQMEWGYAILKASDSRGSSHNTIKNCAVTLTRFNPASIGIYLNNITPADPVTQLTIASSSGTSSFNKFYGNSISNVYTGIYLNGFNDPNTPYTYYDQNNDIGSVAGNSVTNFGGGVTTVYGIYASYQNNLVIANSVINGGAGTTAALYGIFGGTANLANTDIYENTVTLTSGGTTNGLYGIYNTALGNNGTANTLNIYNNSVINCSYSTATAVNFYGIYDVSTAGTINVYGNNVQNNIIAGSSGQYLIYTNSTAGNSVNVYNNIISGNQCSGANAQTVESYIFGIQTIGWGNTTIHDNQVYNNSIPNQTVYGGIIYGIHTGFSATNLTAYNNSVHDLSVTSSATANTNHIVYGFYAAPNSFSNAASNSLHDNNIYNLTMTLNSIRQGYIYGIYAQYINNIYSNTISDLLFTNSSSGYGYGAGIYSNNTAGNGNIYKNSITNVTMPGTTGYFNGIYLSSGDNYYVYNNFISDINTPVSTSTTAISGIYVNNPIQAKLYYNTIYLNATSTSATTFHSSGIYASTTPFVEIKNNIVVNTSSAPGSTTYKTAAYRRSSTSLTTYSLASNNNDFFAGTPSTNNLIFYDGTNSIQTIGDFKVFAVQRDANSLSELPPFVNISTTPYDLHLNSNITNKSQCESAAAVISTLVSITTDFDGDPRFPNPGYPELTGFPPTAPDIGADEFAGVPRDFTSPNIAFTPLTKTSSTSARTLLATITDATGVPTSGSGLPVLYWKKFAAGTWNAATASWISGNTYSFTFGGGVVPNDSVYYYVMAQDIAATANVGGTPQNASGFTADPPAASVPPPNASCYSYKIVGTLCGVYNVGAGQTYTTLTAAVADLNAREVTCPVVFQLMDATYGSETFPITITNPTGVNATNTVTIKPATGVTATVSGSSPSSAILKLNSASYIAIDGSNSGGTDRSLTISNTVTTGTTAVIWIGSSGTGNGSTNDIIRNCNINNGYITSTSYDIFVGNSSGIGSSGDDNDNLTIQNNVISKANRGIYVVASMNGQNDNLTISNNMIGSSTSSAYVLAYGIYLAGTNQASIAGNEIYNMIGSVSSNLTGIELNNNVTNTLIKENKIHDIINSNTSASGAYGINIGVAANVTNATVVNNVIYNLHNPNNNSVTAQYNPFGIRIMSGSGHKVYHNTVNLYGSQSPGGTSGTLSACVAIYYPILTNFELRNNILANSITGLAGSNSYCIFAAAGSQFSIIDNNDYYPSGTYGVLGFLGANINTISGWQGATGQDVNSKSVDPVFTTQTNLVPTTTAMPHAGVYLASVPADILGILRTNPPDIGAYEYTANPLLTTAAATGVSDVAATLNGSANANGTTFSLFFDYGLTGSYGSSVAATPATVTGSTLTPVNASISGLTASTTYHFRARGVTSGGLTVYGNDLTFTTTSPLKSVNLSQLFLEGLYAGESSMNQAYDDQGPHWPTGVADHITVELHTSSSYSSIEYSSADVTLNTTGTASLTIPASFAGSYYLTVKHRNSIETTSAEPVSFSSSVINYAFNPQSQAYGDNMASFIDGTSAIYGGDENQDGLVDGTDLSDVGNLADLATSGYLPQDINGDGLIDGSDLSIAGNNADSAIGLVTP